MALAQLRAGNNEEAVEGIETAMQNQLPWGRAIGVPRLAIAHHHLGEVEAARQWLAKSRLLMHDYSYESQPDATRVFTPAGLRPFHWLYALLLAQNSQDAF